jgi:hypothetical protein
MPVIPTPWKAESKRTAVRDQPRQIVPESLISKIMRPKWTGSVAHTVEHLICKYKALSSNPSPTKKKYTMTVPGGELTLKKHWLHYYCHKSFKSWTWDSASPLESFSKFTQSTSSAFMIFVSSSPRVWKCFPLEFFLLLFFYFYF